MLRNKTRPILVAQLPSLQIQAGISTTLGPFAPIAEKL